MDKCYEIWEPHYYEFPAYCAISGFETDSEGKAYFGHASADEHVKDLI
jgi:hypothetical protein